MAPSIFGRFNAPRLSPSRTGGRPPSANGASSLHLIWNVPPVPLRSVAVTLTVTEPPVVPDLYFWALQVSYIDGERRTGAGHLGLQHNPAHPGGTAANWGGYDEHGTELAGSLLLRSEPGNPNTGDYVWHAKRSYRLRVEPAGTGRWRGSITDLASNTETVVRELECAGSALASPMTWSEVFAPCDAPTTEVVWSQPTVHTGDGVLVQVDSARASYQLEADGGCSNTSAIPVGDGIAQRTTVERMASADQLVSFVPH